MSKRSRAQYEASLQKEQSPFVAYGTPLPPADPSVRDDGSFVPLWKQEVRDEQGRRRLHGAFTGGWSAGYYNTVGSKEGWTPSSFVSSRTDRHKDRPGATPMQPEDYMDAEDLAEADEARRLTTSRAFSGLGQTQDDTGRSGLAGLFRVSGETMGTRLLKAMGWREGQGIGPKVRRAARLDVGRSSDAHDAHDTHETFLFAPEDVVVARVVAKTGRAGLGYESQSRLVVDDTDESDDDLLTRGRPSRPRLGRSRTKRTGGIGVGVLNDTGSDDDDPYDMGPRITFHRVIGGNKKKQKPKTEAVAVPEAVPEAVPKRVLFRRGAARVCHDGRPPLAGFVLAKRPDPLTADVHAPKFPPPVIPPGWRPSRMTNEKTKTTNDAFVSTADAAKASTLDPKARSAVLGETLLPGKSVFDFLTPEARARIASATGRTDLPAARSEVPAAYARTADQKREQLLQSVPVLDKATAVAAITRGARGGGPYQDNEAKRSRYRAYLESQAGIASALPDRPPGVSDDDWLREFFEFANCARIFKPMAGVMASRFTTPSTTSSTASQGQGQGQGPSASASAGLSRSDTKRHKAPDPAEEAASMGMYGPLTRTTADFVPCRLLCKRLGVPVPVAVPPDTARPDTTSSSSWPSASASAALLMQETHSATAAPAAPVVQAGRNDALEAPRASDDVFRAVFGDSDGE